MQYIVGWRLVIQVQPSTSWAGVADRGRFPHFLISWSGELHPLPGLAYPVEVAYESFSEKTGIFGFAWRSPQLESSAVWDKDGVLWTTPWGEKMKFRPKKKKLPKNAVKIALHEDAKKGKGYYSPYSDWEADTSAKRPEISGNWTFSGKKYTVYYFMRYDVAYLGKVRKVVDGRGRDVIDFRYDKSTGRPIRVRDRLGNDINFEWDANAYISRQTKRTAGSSTIEPVRSYVCDKAGNPVSVSELDADGNAVRLDTNIHGAMKIGVMV